MANAETQQTNDAPAPAQLLRWIRELVPAWAADDIGSFRYLDGGYSNRNYRFAHGGAQYVLRVPFRQRPFVDRSQEQTLLRTARLRFESFHIRLGYPSFTRAGDICPLIRFAL